MMPTPTPFLKLASAVLPPQQQNDPACGVLMRCLAQRGVLYPHDLHTLAPPALDRRDGIRAGQRRRRSVPRRATPLSWRLLTDGLWPEAAPTVMRNAYRGLRSQGRTAPSGFTHR